MSERPENHEVLKRKIELKQLLEDRRHARRNLKDNPNPTHERELKKIEYNLDLNRKAIRASRARTRRAGERKDGTADRRKREAKSRQREQDKQYLFEIEKYMIKDLFVEYHDLTWKRQLICITCSKYLKAGDLVYLFPESSRLPGAETSFIHVGCRVPHHMITRHKENRRGSLINDIFSDDILKRIIELERKRKEELKPVETMKIDNLERVRQGLSRVVQ